MANLQIHNLPLATSLFSDTETAIESNGTSTAYETQRAPSSLFIDNTTITQNGSFQYQVATGALIDGTTLASTSNVAHVNTSAIVDGTTLGVTSNVAHVIPSAIGATYLNPTITWTTELAVGQTITYNFSRSTAFRVFDMAQISIFLGITVTGTPSNIIEFSATIPSIFPNNFVVGDINGVLETYTQAPGITLPFLNAITTINGTNKIAFQTNQQLVGSYQYTIQASLTAYIR